MNVQASSDKFHGPFAGVVFGASSFLIWGISPIYWKAIRQIPALEIIAHRVVWSFVFLLPLVFALGKRRELAAALKNRRTFMILLSSSLLVALNWLVYIWAVNTDRMLQASLGYYINPLVNVLLGVVFLKERLRKPQTAAVLLATAGVVYLTYFYGEFPWIALTLAFLFGTYGLIRKVAPVDSVTGLTVETMLLTLPSIVYLYSLDASGTGAFLNSGFTINILLLGCAPLTAIPLLLFTMGARRLHLSTMGFLQYIAPTFMFLLGVFVYHEPFMHAQLITFIMIWTALGIYSADSAASFRASVKKKRNRD